MDPKIIAAIISASGVIVSVVVSLLIAFLSRRYNYHQLFAETVSKNRMEWINVWRQNISIFLSTAKALRSCKCVNCTKAEHKNCSCSKYTSELKRQMGEAQSMITMRLNMAEELHQLMFAAIHGFEYDVKDEEFNKKCEYIETTARAILKIEWERVKDEARGKENY